MKEYKVKIKCSEIGNRFEDDIEVHAETLGDAEKAAWEYIFDMYINDQLPEEDDEDYWYIHEQLSGHYNAEIVEEKEGK